MENEETKVQQICCLCLKIVQTVSCQINRRVLIDRLAARVCYTDLNNYSNQMHRNKKIICPYLLVKAVSFVVVFTCPPVSDILVVM